MLPPEIPRTIAVDFDDTLCASHFPDTGKMMPGAKDAMVALKKLGYRLLIYSCRTCHWHYDVFGGSREIPTLERDHVINMIEWLNANEIPYDEVDDGSKGKPVAHFYIDDKGVRYNNNWAEIVEFVSRHE